MPTESHSGDVTTREVWIEERLDTKIENDYLNLVQTTLILMTSLLIFTVGMLGNVTTIYIFTRSKKLRQTKVFELILAAFDVYALSLVLPLLTTDLIWEGSVGQLGNIALSVCGHGYYLTILCSTIRRYVAVFHPFSYNAFFEKWRPRFLGSIVMVTILLTTPSVLFNLVLKIKRSPIFFIDAILSTFVSFATTSFLFARIISRLMKTNTVATTVATTTQSVEMEVHNQDSSTSLQTSPTQFRRKHLVATKTFATISLCFVVCYVTAFLAAARLIPRSWFLLYFTNHICNPFIYIVFNREFRQNVRSLLRV